MYIVDGQEFKDLGSADLFSRQCGKPIEKKVKEIKEEKEETPVKINKKTKIK